MDPSIILLITELIKLGFSTYAAYMRQLGMTEAEIEAVFADAKKGMLERDPANIPA